MISPERRVSWGSGEERQSGPTELGPQGASWLLHWRYPPSLRCVWMLQGNVGVINPGAHPTSPHPPTPQPGMILECMLFAYFREKGQSRSKRRARIVQNMRAIKVRSDRMVESHSFPTGRFPCGFLIPNKRQMASHPLGHRDCRQGSSFSTGSGAGGAVHLLHLRAQKACESRTPPPVAHLPEADSWLGEAPCCRDRESSPGLPGKLLGLLCVISWHLCTPCLHLMYIYSRGLGASAGPGV